MRKQETMTYQLQYPLDGDHHSVPRLVVPGMAAGIDLLNAPVRDWAIYLPPAAARDVGRQVARWLTARVQGAGHLEAIGCAVIDGHSGKYIAINMEAAHA